MDDTPTNLQFLVLERIDPSINASRFYVLSVEATLFPGDYALIREWGRRGLSARRRLDLFGSKQAAMCSLETWLNRKRRRGYRAVEPA